LAVSEDHMIVAQRVTQQKADNDSLLPMLAEVQRQCGAPPQTVLADAGYYKNANLRQLEAEKIDAYIPDSNMAGALNLGRRGRGKARGGEMKNMLDNLTRWHAERDPHSAIWCRRRARERRRNPRQTNNHKARTCRNT